MFVFEGRKKASEEVQQISVRANGRIAFNTMFCEENEVEVGTYVCVALDAEKKQMAFKFDCDVTNGYKLCSDKSAKGLWLSCPLVKNLAWLPIAKYTPKKSKQSGETIFVIEGE